MLLERYLGAIKRSSSVNRAICVSIDSNSVLSSIPANDLDVACRKRRMGSTCHSVVLQGSCVTVEATLGWHTIEVVVKWHMDVRLTNGSEVISCLVPGSAESRYF